LPARQHTSPPKMDEFQAAMKACRENINMLLFLIILVALDLNGMAILVAISWILFEFLKRSVGVEDPEKRMERLVRAAVTKSLDEPGCLCGRCKGGG